VVDACKACYNKGRKELCETGDWTQGVRDLPTHDDRTLPTEPNKRRDAIKAREAIMKDQKALIKVQKAALDELTRKLNGLKNIGLGSRGGTSTHTVRRLINEIVARYFTNKDGSVDKVLVEKFLAHEDIKDLNESVEVDEVAVKVGAGLTDEAYCIVRDNLPGMLPSLAKMQASRATVEEEDMPPIYYAIDGSPGVCCSPKDIINMVLSKEAEMGAFDIPASCPYLWVMMHGDGCSVNHHRKEQVFIESMSFPHQASNLALERNHVVAMMPYSESYAAHRYHLSRVMALMEDLQGKKFMVNGIEKEVRFLRSADGSELAKNTGTSGFNAVCPCTMCVVRKEDYADPWWRRDEGKSKAREFLVEGCDHVHDDCACASHYADVLNNKYGVDWDSDANVAARSPADADGIRAFIKKHCYGFAHRPVNGGAFLKGWSGTLYYDPFHLIHNCFKKLWELAVDVHNRFDLSDKLSAALGHERIKLDTLQVDQSDAYTESLKRKKNYTVREKHADLLGAERKKLLQLDDKVCTLTDRSDLESNAQKKKLSKTPVANFIFLAPLAAAAAEGVDGTQDALNVLHEMFTVHAKLSGLYLNADAAGDADAEETRAKEFETLVTRYYNLWETAGHRCQVGGYKERLRWPDHYLSDHAADDMRNMFKTVGVRIGCATCQTCEHLNHWAKRKLVQNTNSHTSTTHLSDNKYRQALRDKLLAFCENYATSRVAERRNFKECQECKERGWNEDADGNQIPHQISKDYCAREMPRKLKRPRPAGEGQIWSPTKE
jgi:hypothetical protein